MRRHTTCSAWCTWNLQENAVAGSSFERAPRSSRPNDPDINNNYGWFLCQTGREKESINYFVAALKNPLYTTPENAYVNAGVCCACRATSDGAKTTSSARCALQPDQPQALLNLALVDSTSAASWTQRAAYRTRHMQAGSSRQPNRCGWRCASSASWATAVAETSLAAQLRRRFSGSRESQDLLKGKFE